MIPDANFTLAAAKEHLRVTHADEDALITRLLDAAVGLAETGTRRAWTERAVIALVDRSLAVDDAQFHAELSPASDAKVFTFDGIGGEVQLPATDVFVSTSFGHSIINVRAWSPTLVPEGDAARIEYTATPFGVPPDVVAAVMLYLGHLYANRESQIVGTVAVDNPLADMLLRPYVIELYC